MVTIKRTIKGSNGKEYIVVLGEDDKGWWLARVVGIRGVNTFGRTVEQALTNAKEALDLAIDTDTK